MERMETGRTIVLSSATIGHVLRSSESFTYIIKKSLDLQSGWELAMNRAKVNFVVDAASFAAFVLLLSTGVLVHYVLPPGSGHFYTLWGLDRHDWGGIHFWIAVVFLCTMGFHLFLHWRWVVNMVNGYLREGSGVRVALVIISLLSLLCIAISPFFSSVEHSGDPPRRSRSFDRK